MSKIGVFKPLRGTYDNLKNIVLEEGEIAFEYPSTPGSGKGAIKMGDGTTIYSSLPYFLGLTTAYNTGTNEAALIDNLRNCERETIGKIYYIQSYYSNKTNSDKSTSSVIRTDMPWKVIGINHDDTENTMDLWSLCSVFNTSWLYDKNYSQWSDGRYTVSKIYEVVNNCINGFSNQIQSHMINMTERWRQATGENSGIMQSRNTKVKMLNTVELFGLNSANSYRPNDGYDSSYGTLYEAFQDTTGELSSRKCYFGYTVNDNNKYNTWTNCWTDKLYGVGGAVTTHGNGNGGIYEEQLYGHYIHAICPVIRLTLEL